MKTYALLTFVLVAAACGGDDDSADAAPAFDAKPITRTDRAYVLNRIVLPRTEEDVMASAFDYPGGPGYPVNKMGGLTTVLLDLVDPLPVQMWVEQGIADGETLNAWIINSGPVDEDDPSPTLTFTYLEDSEDPADPTNNLELGAQLRVQSGYTPLLVSDQGNLSGGVIEASGDVETVWGYMLKLNDEFDPYLAPGIHGIQRLTITENTIAGGTSSVLTLDQLHTDVFPGIAEILNRAVSEGVPMAATISAVYDTDSNGTITVQELIDNDTMASLTQPDVDVDGDGVNDHISQGSVIEGTRIELVE